MYNPRQIIHPAMGMPYEENWAYPDINLHEVVATYHDVLDKKQVYDVPALVQMLRYDFSRMNYVLNQIQTFDVVQALRDFFEEDYDVLPAFISGIKAHRLNHMGLEIYTPLNTWLALAPIWLDSMSQFAGVPVKVTRTARFPSSQALQTRVGAAVEIMCAWFQIPDTRFMIELFDIARPIPDSIYQNGSVEDSFRHDPIWHYAIDVDALGKVDEIHDTFMQLAVIRPDYRLAYFQPVTNRHDGSYHTKIIHKKLGMELEFAYHEPLLH
ncbi:MAG: hypothetical protein ACR2HF_16440 [Methylococcaceae bacterium]